MRKMRIVNGREIDSITAVIFQQPFGNAVLLVGTDHTGGDGFQLRYGVGDTVALVGGGKQFQIVFGIPEGNYFFTAKIRRKLPGGMCDITISDRMQATIRCASIRTTISGFDPVEYPELPQVQGSSFSVAQNVLRDMIGRTIFAIAVDESRPILTGCLMEIEKTEMRVVALDGFRLAIRKENIEGPENSVSAVVGGKVLGDIAKILADTDEPVSMCFSRSHVQMNVGATHIVARLLEGEFIRYRQILPQEWQTRVAVRRTELSSAIDRASLIAREGKSNLVCFKIDGDALMVTSNSENGDMEEKMDVTTEGKDLTIAFNVRYITDVLKALSDDEVFMRFNSNVSPCVVCPTEGDSYLYLVLPVRVFNS